ncbi:MAG: ABC transporter substrate-binding protein [Rhizobiaceae bacterium]|nr:ABC transporter substrate-binding protein [Rhizobiaceae bacterium]
MYTKARIGLMLVGLAFSTSHLNAATLAYCSETNPESFDPPQTTAQSTADATMPIFETLIGMTPGTTNLRGFLAESWEASEDGKAYTFHLRRGVKFHSTATWTPTRDFNADDVIFSFKRQVDAEHPFHKVGSGLYPHYAGSGFQGLVSSVDKVDDYTVKFTLVRPDVAFLAMLSMGTYAVMMSEEYSQALTASGEVDKWYAEPVGTGAFKFVGFQRDAWIRYQANPDHWAKAAGFPELTSGVDQMVFLVTTDPAVRFAKLQAGECHIIRFANPADIISSRDNPDIDVHELASADYGFVAYNVEKKPFDDVRVRQALNYAINKQAIMETIFRGDIATLAGGVLPPVFAGHDPSIEPYAYDPERAKALLAEAGLPDGFSTTLWAMPVVRAYMPNAKRTAELMQQDLAAVGVKAEITTMEWADYLQKSIEGQHEMAILGWNYAYADPGQILKLGWSCETAVTGLNRSRWCNKDYDAAVNAAGLTSVEADRSANYKVAQKIFHDEAPALLLAYAKKIALTSPKVSGYKVAPVGQQPFVGVTLAD